MHFSAKASHTPVDFKAVLGIRIRIRMFLGFPDPDPLVHCTDWILLTDPSIIKSKNSKKNIDSYIFVTSYDFYL